MWLIWPPFWEDPNIVNEVTECGPPLLNQCDTIHKTLNGDAAATNWMEKDNGILWKDPIMCHAAIQHSNGDAAATNWMEKDNGIFWKDPIMCHAAIQE